MFGTLVIQLPSNYTGGKLIVYHQGKKSEFDYSGSDCCGNCYFTSFYADCQHEVEKVTKGYRLCLIYNLMYQGLDECPTPTDNQAQVSAIVSAMKQWQEDVNPRDCPNLMIYLMEHKYCEASLSFQLLKNGNRAVAEVLTQAKAEVDFDFYVAHIKFNEHWAADEHYYGRYFTATEHSSDSVSVKHMKSSDGERIISKLDLHSPSLIPEDFFEDVEPDDEVHEEATGNEGALIDKQYNWTGLLFWPLNKRTDVIGVCNMIDFFKQDVDTGKKDLHDVAREIMKEIRRRWLSSYQSVLEFLDVLQVIGDIKLIAEMLDVIADINERSCLNYYIEDTAFFSSLISIGRKHGWDVLRSPLQAMFANCSLHNVDKYYTFFNKIVASEILGHEKDLCTNLLSIIVKVLADEPNTIPKDSWLYRDCQPQRSKEFVCQLFGLLTTVWSNDLFASITSAMCTKPDRYPVVEILGPAIVDFYKSTKVEKDGPLQVILTYCVSHLETSLCEIAAALTTNAKPVRFTCSCKDCVELIQFLEHPTALERRFTMGQNRRCHLRNQLYSSGEDVSHTTKRIGSPHTLVVTKTNASHEKALKKQQQQRALLASLQPLLPVTDVDVPSENEPPTKKQKGITAKVDTGSSCIDLT